MFLEEEEEEEEFDPGEDRVTHKTIFLIDNSSTIYDIVDKFKIQVEVCKHIFSHNYENNVHFGIGTLGNEESGIRCSPTNSMKAPRIVIENITCGGNCDLKDVILKVLLCFTQKKEGDLNRVHCILKEDYLIPKRVMKKIKELCDQFNIIIDIFILGDYIVTKEQYKGILSEKSIFKCINTMENNEHVASQLLIEEIFALYSDYLISENNQNLTDNLKEDNQNTVDVDKPVKNKRKRVQEADARNIYQMFIQKNDTFAKELCESLGYSKSTYYNIINNEGKVSLKYKNPEREKKWKEDHINKALEIIGENPVLSLEEIIDKTVEETSAKKVAKSSLSSYLKAELITLKSCQLDPVARNSVDTKESRKKYCNEVLRKIHRTYVFIDEMGYSCSIQRNRGRSKKGTRCVRKGPLLKAPNVSVCMAVSKEDGIIYYSRQNNAFDGETFAQFMNELIEKCKELNHENICFVMDNVRIHKSEESIREQCDKNNIELLFLPVYSPELNPIEKVFSILKAHIKKLLRTKYHEQLLETANAPWGQKARTREKIISDALNESLPKITVELMEKLWEDMLEVFAKVFDNEDI